MAGKKGAEYRKEFVHAKRKTSGEGYDVSRGRRWKAAASHWTIRRQGTVWKRQICQLVLDRRKPNGADEGRKRAPLDHGNVQYDTGMRIGMSVRETIELDVTADSAETSRGERKT